MKKYEDVLRIVRDEVETIRRRDGELPRTAYVVMEVIDRLKTLKEWEGKDPGKSVALSLREVVEAYIKNPKIRLQPKMIKNLYEDAETIEDEFFGTHPELEVDWENGKSVQKFVNKEIPGPTIENLNRSARREIKKARKNKQQIRLAS